VQRRWGQHCLATPNQKPPRSSTGSPSPSVSVLLRFRRSPPGDADAPDEGAAGEEPRGGVQEEPGDRLSEEGPEEGRGQTEVTMFNPQSAL